MNNGTKNSIVIHVQNQGINLNSIAYTMCLSADGVELQI